MSSSRRVFRSSSIGDVGVFNSVRPIEAPSLPRTKNHHTPTKAQSKPSNPVQKTVEQPKKPPAKSRPEKPHRSVLTIGSPVRDGEDYGSRWSKAEEKFGVFYEACFRCKKKIPEKEDIYMFGYLRAFCSEECREVHMDLEKMDEEPFPKSTATKLMGQPSNQLVGSQPKKFVAVEKKIGEEPFPKSTAPATTKLKEKPAKLVISSQPRHFLASEKRGEELFPKSTAPATSKSIDKPAKRALRFRSHEV